MGLSFFLVLFSDILNKICLNEVYPSPSCQPKFEPQHFADPLSRMAQVWISPDEMATAVLPIPRLLVRVGVSLSEVPP